MPLNWLAEINAHQLLKLLHIFMVMVNTIKKHQLICIRQHCMSDSSISSCSIGCWHEKNIFYGYKKWSSSTILMLMLMRTVTVLIYTWILYPAIFHNLRLLCTFTWCIISRVLAECTISVGRYMPIIYASEVGDCFFNFAFLYKRALLFTAVYFLPNHNQRSLPTHNGFFYSPIREHLT